MGGSQGPAELVVEDLPTGEHLFELKKECYRDERLKDVLTIDLMDSSPKIYKPIRMVPASTTLTFVGGPSGAEVFVDGSPHHRDYVQAADERKRRRLKALGHRAFVVRADDPEGGLSDLTTRVGGTP